MVLFVVGEERGIRFLSLFFLFSMENNNHTFSTEKEEGSNMVFGSKMVFGRVFCFQYLDTI